MEFAVALKVGAKQWPVFLSGSGVVCLHTHIETHEEIGKIHAKSQSIGKGDLLVEFVEAEHPTRLVGIVADSPNVAGIHESGAFEHPEEFGAKFQVGIESDIATLVDETVLRISCGKATRSERAHAPPSHAVGATGVEPLFERHHRGVAVGHCHPCSHVHRNGGAVVEIVGVGLVGVQFHILRISDAEHLVAFIVLFMLSEEFREAVEQFAGGFDGCSNGVNVLLHRLA